MAASESRRLRRLYMKAMKKREKDFKKEFLKASKDLSIPSEEVDKLVTNLLNDHEAKT